MKVQFCNCANSGFDQYRFIFEGFKDVTPEDFEMSVILELDSLDDLYTIIDRLNTATKEKKFDTHLYPDTLLVYLPCLNDDCDLVAQIYDDYIE